MYKQIIIVRKDLEMSPGKLAAQVSHASMAFLSTMIKEHAIGEVFEGTGDNQEFMKEEKKYRIESFDIDKGLFEEWLGGTFTKCILKARNKTNLLKAAAMAEEMGLEENKDFFIIKDNCYTELVPEEIDENGVGRTITCIGFVPMEAEKINKIGKKYQLF